MSEELANMPDPEKEKIADLDFQAPKHSADKNSFQSLAEIASCSYEARKVNSLFS